MPNATDVVCGSHSKHIQNWVHHRFHTWPADIWMHVKINCSTGGLCGVAAEDHLIIVVEVTARARGDAPGPCTSVGG